MNLVEIVFYNIGGVNKRYDYFVGCLIVFVCREFFKLENSYKGFFVFEFKIMLIDWYIEKYCVKIVMG